MWAFVLVMPACAAPPSADAEAKRAIAGSEKDLPATLRDGIPKWLEAARIPGLVVAWVEGGEVQTAAFGTMSNRGGGPVGAETVFEAASLSKPVFAYAVMRLVERGRLDLDRPLTTYLSYEDLEPDPRVNLVTARKVLSHTGGFPNWRRGEKLGLAFEPGERFGYSGEGFVFLQRVVEKLTGLNADHFVRREVFEPLGMSFSSFLWQKRYERLAATGHDFLGEPRDKGKPEEVNAAASLHTTAGDYGRFLAEMLEPTLVKEETLKAMLTPQVRVEDGVAWGLGWGLEGARLSPPGGDDGELGEADFFWHWGDNGIFRCLTLAARGTESGKGRALVYFTNSENGLAIKGAMARVAFGEKAHPGLDWTGYDAFDSPAWNLRFELIDAGLESGAAGVRRAYRELRKTHSAEDFEENAVNRLGYQLMSRRERSEGTPANGAPAAGAPVDQALAAAVEIFRINVELYPQSWNAYDSLGEALMESGETAAAVRNYRKSLELNPDNGNAVEMLKRLEGAEEIARP